MINLAQIMEMKMQLELDRIFHRQKVLDSIKDPVLRMEQKKIWAISDAAEEIASAIRSTQSNRGFFF